MKNLNYRNLYEEMTEKEKSTLISTERKIKHLCKCWSKEPTPKLYTRARARHCPGRRGVRRKGGFGAGFHSDHGQGTGIGDRGGV